MANHVGPNTSSAIPADSSENLQLAQRNNGPEPTTIARDRSLQSTKGKHRLLIKENVFWTYLPWFFKAQFIKKVV